MFLCAGVVASFDCLAKPARQQHKSLGPPAADKVMKFAINCRWHNTRSVIEQYLHSIRVCVVSFADDALASFHVTRALATGAIYCILWRQRLATIRGGIATTDDDNLSAKTNTVSMNQQPSDWQAMGWRTNWTEFRVRCTWKYRLYGAAQFR